MQIFRLKAWGPQLRIFGLVEGVSIAHKGTEIFLTIGSKPPYPLPLPCRFEWYLKDSTGKTRRIGVTAVYNAGQECVVTLPDIVPAKV